jgi:hypothetical protein
MFPRCTLRARRSRCSTSSPARMTWWSTPWRFTGRTIPVGQIVQCRRALASDGLFLRRAFGGETLHELRNALAEAEIAETGGLSPRVAPMAEVRQMGALLQRAGLALPVADAHRMSVSYGDIFALMKRSPRDGGNQRADRPTPQTGAEIAFRPGTGHLCGPLPEGEGRIRATFEVIYLTGWAPHESQQKPLRPGSAQTRLAAALNATHVQDNTAAALDRADD